ncbi:rhodanese-like domain-containing protein 4, chloroplastic [Andrographis paniculata]|uniref:rhodanese-like domain-containing protein 4, chloroplastic n=1 Tax=Andrographis paniculata TaxID=175694 RepID=UPI0021E7411B|nr:rhodanese-like domain-containing protein 4, chloroplastic [Andrographis paniculata]
MEALKAAVSPKPVSVLPKRNKTNCKNNFSFSPTPLSRFKTKTSPNFRPNSNPPSNFLSAPLILLSSIAISASNLAKALSYEEALQQTVSGGGGGDFDIAGVFDSFTSFAADNGVIIGGVAAILAAPLAVAQLIGGKPKAWGVVNAKTAYEKLGEDPEAQLVDIREPSEMKEVGSPDIRGLKKSAIAVGFRREDKAAFLNFLSLKMKDPQNTTLFVLDKFDGNSELVAELATANGFKAAFAIRDGAEGWLNSSLPWILPKKAFSFDPSRVFDAISDAFGVASERVPFIFGTAAAAFLGLVTYTEVEPILQVLGSIAILQFIRQKLASAEKRERTAQQIDEFLTTKIVIKDLPGDIQKIGKALLPVAGKALPVETSPDVQTNLKAAVEAAAVSGPKPGLNSVPQAQIFIDLLPGLLTPLSPYPNYPDYKPPSSPMPSQP